MTAWSPLLRRNRCSGTLSRSLSVSQLGHGNAEAQAWRGLSRESTLVPEEPRRPSEERPAAVRASDADRLGPEGRRTARGRTQAQVHFDSVSPGEWKAKERVLGAAAHPALPSVPSERVRPTHRSGVTGCRWLLDPGCAVPREGPPCPARVRRRLFSDLIVAALFCCVMEPPRESVLVRAICGALPLLSLGLGGIVFGCTAVDRRAEWEPRPHHCPSILQPFGVRDAGRAGGGARALAAA